SAIRNVESFPIVRNAVRDLKLSRPSPRAPPDLNALPFGRVFQDASVSITIGNKQPAARAKADISRPTQSREGAFFGRGHFPDGDLLQLLALRRELQQNRIPRIHRPDIAGGINPNAVGNRVHPLAPRAQHTTLAVDHDHRVRLVAALENIDESVA